MRKITITTRSQRVFPATNIRIPANELSDAVRCIYKRNAALIQEFDQYLYVFSADDSNATRLRLFAVWCARQVAHLVCHQKIAESINATERFIYSNADWHTVQRYRVAAEKEFVAQSAGLTEAQCMAHCAGLLVSEPDAVKAVKATATYAICALQFAGVAHLEQKSSEAARKKLEIYAEVKARQIEKFHEIMRGAFASHYLSATRSGGELAKIWQV